MSDGKVAQDVKYFETIARSIVKLDMSVPLTHVHLELITKNSFAMIQRMLEIADEHQPPRVSR